MYAPLCACDGPACYVAKIHLLDYCKRQKTTPAGEMIMFLCSECSPVIAWALERIPKNRKCKSCGKSVDNLHDLLDMENL